jgi:hypothetical protein
MRKVAAGLVLAVALALFPWQVASGQVSIGAHASYMSEIGTGFTAQTADGTVGVGGRLGIGIPVVGIKLLGTVDMFFPDCGTEDCDFHAATANLLYTIPIPVLISPYFGAGIAVQNSEGGSSFLGDLSDWGINLMAGFSLDNGGSFQPFVEGKYQIMNDFDDQLVISAGLSFSTW